MRERETIKLVVIDESWIDEDESPETIIDWYKIRNSIIILLFMYIGSV